MGDIWEEVKTLNNKGNVGISELNNSNNNDCGANDNDMIEVIIGHISAEFYKNYDKDNQNSGNFTGRIIGANLSLKLQKCTH